MASGKNIDNSKKGDSLFSEENFDVDFQQENFGEEKIYSKNNLSSSENKKKKNMNIVINSKTPEFSTPKIAKVNFF